MKNHLQAICAIGLLGLFAGCIRSDATQVQNDPSDVRIMSFNILYIRSPDKENTWEKRKDLVVDMIKKTSADTVGLQEAEFPQVEYLKKCLSDQYGFVLAYADGGTGNHSNALLYRKDRWMLEEHGSFWFSSTPDKPASMGWGNSKPRLCTWARLVDKKTGKGYYHFNTHLDHKSQPSRERSAVLIAQRIAQRTHPEDPFAVTGDFNSKENNPVVGFFKGGTLTLDGKTVSNPVPMTDCLRAIHGDQAKIATYNGFNPSRTYDRIDYVWAGGFDKVLDAQVLQDRYDGRYPSDHFPTTADLRLKQ